MPNTEFESINKDTFMKKVGIVLRVLCIVYILLKY